MKILSLALAAALAAYAPSALAQSTGSGISILPPHSKETAKETAKETSKDSTAKPENPAADQGTTGKASGSRTDKPGHARNSEAPSTTGSAGIQSGRVK
jgi:hypothetical protein